jgi:S1-C subfamily serine protease
MFFPTPRLSRLVIALLAASMAPLGCAQSTRPDDKVDVRQDPVVRAVQKVLPTVVNIGTTRIVTRQYRDPFEELFSQFFGRPPAAPPREQEAHSLGSGVIVDPSGFIITNEHVVQRASKITVKLADGSEYEATYLAGDAKNDLALLKIEPKQPLQAVELGVDEELLLGETVISLGNPFGLEHTVTKGVLSAKNRRAMWEGKVVFDDILQTDAAINPGNSGGPLIDVNGRLIGINVAILAEAQGIGFAIPVRRVAALLTEWFSLEKSKRIWLGLKWKQEKDRITIAEVQAKSPAAHAGLRPGDALVKMDGKEFASLLDVQKWLLQKSGGDSVAFTVKRGEREVAATVKLLAIPKPNGFELAKSKLGLSLQEITAEIGGHLMLTAGRGLLVTEVAQETEATRVGLKPGMVVLAVNGTEVNKLDEIGEALQEVNAGDKVTLLVHARAQQGGFIIEQTVNVTLTAR